MKILELKNVGQDHIEEIARFRNPIAAIEELIWNSLDADATRVEVCIEMSSSMGGLDQIVVSDNGIGMRYADCERAFSSLGNSNKRNQNTTPKGRVLHGKSGKGRYRAFGVGRCIKWRSRYEDEGMVKEFEVRGLRSSLKKFEIGEESHCNDCCTGVHVFISDIERNHPSLTRSETAVTELSHRLALYLKQYPGIEVYYDGQRIDPSLLEASTEEYQMTLKDKDERDVPAVLSIIEWKRPTDRALYLCDEKGFALDQKPPGIRAPGFYFTAYLKSELIAGLAEENAFSLDRLHPVADAIIVSSRELLRRHFREREAARLGDLVQQWKNENVYPYQDTPQNPLAKAEREVFDICAASIHEYLPGFEKSEQKNKKLTFRLIRESLERSSSSLDVILREVLNLPEDEQAELAAILSRTQLGAILSATKTVVDRLDFLASLDSLLFGDYKDSLLERKQLHKILAQELWIFGEQYSLGVDDQSLKALLEKNVALLGRESLAAPSLDDVTDLDGRNRIVDLMLFSQYPQCAPNQFEHLVVELKRPSCKLGKDEIGQIENYAFSVADDERFDKAQTKWTFVLIGNDVTPFADNRCKVQGREYGHIHASNDGSVDIFVRKWSTVVAQAKWRYKFFKERLELLATSEDGMQYLRKKHARLVPSGHAASQDDPPAEA